MVGVQQEHRSNIGNTGRGTAGCWSAEHVLQIRRQPLPEAALIHARDALPIDPALVLWDLWPVQTDDGALAQVCGGTLWVILSAPRCGNPDARHDVARMRLFHRIARIDEIDEVDALDDAAVLDVETRDDADLECHGLFPGLCAR